MECETTVRRCCRELRRNGGTREDPEGVSEEDEEEELEKVED